MKKETMTPRERWLAAMKFQPVDRLPFWPKLTAAYPRAQAAPFNTMPLDAIHDWVGSDKHGGIGSVIIREKRNKSSVTSAKDGDKTITTFGIGNWQSRRVDQFDAPSAATHPVEFPVHNVEDIKRMTEHWNDVEVELNVEGLAKAKEYIQKAGGSVSFMSSIGTTGFQNWLEHLAAFDEAHMMLADYPDEVQALFNAIHRVMLDRARIQCEHSPADTIYLIENTSTTLASPDQYRKYWMPHIREYAAIAAQHNRLITLHMCGHLKALLADMETLNVACFEAFTSPTLGNTTLLDGRTACPTKCLIGGTNAMDWTEPAGTIIARLERDLGVLPHHRGLVVTSAGVMPPRCKPETIKAVGDWVKAYPAKM